MVHWFGAVHVWPVGTVGAGRTDGNRDRNKPREAASIIVISCRRPVIHWPGDQRCDHGCGVAFHGMSQSITIAHQDDRSR